ncbi:hypothetical protein B6S08_18130 [Oceanimonas doudoroffii]|uniref:Uncharacterized protein n=1 Tax=Oceanimonas doudoroffii TaxID=84158 RepID=A0A233RAA6_9GAMM|nr:hypothetical protein B6S08_18130 [Oceanimonas doudoroffii]
MDDDFQVAASEFEKFFNATGRNKSSIESVLHSCEDVVSSCSIGGEEMNGRNCCSDMEYLATPKGICFVRHSQQHQKEPGVSHGMKFHLKIDAYTNKSRNQTDRDGFDLYLFDSNTEVSSIQAPLTLGSGNRYMVEMELQKKRMFTHKCREERQKWKRHRELKENIHTDKRFRCFKSRIKEECGCVPVASLWSKTAEPEATCPICTTNQTEHCARKWLENWSIELDAEMEWRDGIREKDRLCKPKVPCSRLFWSTKERHFPMKVLRSALEICYLRFINFSPIPFDTCIFHVRRLTGCSDVDPL